MCVKSNFHIALLLIIEFSGTVLLLLTILLFGRANSPFSANSLRQHIDGAQSCVSPEA